MSPRITDESVQAALAQAVASHRAGDLARAERGYRRVLEAEPGRPDVVHLLGLAVHQAGRPAEAVPHLAEAAAAMPGHAGYHRDLGRVYHALGRRDEAIAALRRAAELEPGCAEGRNDLGAVLASAGRWLEAAACHAEALRQKPDYADAHYNLGNAQTALRRFDQAVASYRAAIRLRPDWPDPHINLGHVLAGMGRPEEAIPSLREAARLAPQSFLAHYNLGKALAATGRLDEAAECLRRAVALDPRRPDVHNDLGEALRRLGRADEAIGCFRRAAALAPDFAPAHANLGDAYAAAGRHGKAAAAYAEVLRLKPDEGVACFRLAEALAAQDKLDEAVARYRQAADLLPDSPDAINNLGLALARQGKMDEAIAAYQEAVRRNPAFALGHHNLGCAYEIQGQLDEAIACYRAAVAHQPDMRSAQLCLAGVLLRQEQHAEAVAAYRRAVEIDPTHAAARNSLGEALLAAGDAEAAADAFREAARIDPNLVSALGNLGRTLFRLGAVDEAVAALDQAYRVQPSDEYRILAATLLPPVYSSLDEMHERRGRLIERVRTLHEQGARLDPTQLISSNTFYLAYHGLNDRDVMRQIARLYRPPAEATRPLAPRGGAGRKIDVGFISAHLKNHTIGLLMHGLIRELDRDRFRVTVLSLPHKNDAKAEQIRAHADRHAELPMDLGEARLITAAQELDVLFFTDIGMEPLTYGLAFCRLAPVQCVTWGHPDTTGIDTVDYFISSEALEVPEADEHYHETLVRTRTLPICYERPQGPERPWPRSAFGLPETGHLYCCPQSIFKLHPDFDPILGAILRRDPAGVLALLAGEHRHWNDLLRRRFAATLPDVLDRIHYVPRQSREGFVALMAAADVLLDPVHFGGGNTSYEGLAVGTPIITLPSGFLRGRITWAQYQQMGVLDCAAATPAEYVELAVRAGTDPDYRAALKAKILGANAVLYDNKAGVRELEDFFERAVAAARSGFLPPGGRG